MSSQPSTPESQDSVIYEASPTPRWIFVVFAVVFLAVGWLIYSGQQSRIKLEAEIAKTNQRADLLAQQLEQANSRIAELKGSLEVTTEKLQLTQQDLERARALANAIRKEQKAADEKLVAQIGEVKKESESKIGEVAAGVSGAKSDIEATRKDLEATKAGLQRAMGDMGVMSGLIARNKEEVEELKRRGDRNIYEFDLRKSSQLSRVGPVQMRVKKVDVKRSKFTLDLIADDRTIEKKDKTVGEPVQFYVKGVRASFPHEIVVFEVAKDRVVGYLSTPKETAMRTP
jgi:outer membrane murein-binding lipoprotein Lpp